MSLRERYRKLFQDEIGDEILKAIKNKLTVDLSRTQDIHGSQILTVTLYMDGDEISSDSVTL